MMIKYRLNTENFSDPSCCGSSGACLDCILRRINSAFFMFQPVSDFLYSQPSYRFTVGKH